MFEGLSSLFIFPYVSEKGDAMEQEIYKRLARHLDNLPGGFPPTESGVEMRILRRLFTPEEAKLAVYLTLLAEEPQGRRTQGRDTSG